MEYLCCFVIYVVVVGIYDFVDVDLVNFDVIGKVWVSVVIDDGVFVDFVFVSFK